MVRQDVRERNEKLRTVEVKLRRRVLQNILHCTATSTFIRPERVAIIQITKMILLYDI